MSESKNESSPQKTFSSLLFSSAAQAASEGNGRGPYVQADLAYAAERITHDYPEPTG
ncbi:opacity family porin, partial [Neisseria gonorrhoeae]